MADSENKRNKHVWRKVVGYGPQPKPVYDTYVDLANSQSFTYNEQETIRHRDYFEVKKQFVVSGVIPPNPTPVPFPVGEYDEGVITFDYSDGDAKYFNFNFTFSGNPYVVLTVDSNDDMSNINTYGITYASTGAYIGVSAPYSGNIRYRAIWASSYPAIVSSTFTTSYFTASAGTSNPSNVTYYYQTFGTMLSQPDFALESAWDSANLYSDVFVEDVFLTNSYFIADVSAPKNHDIHFIVYDGVSAPITSSGSGFTYTFGFSFGT